MEKYIIIPECRPLYAMQKCFGPTQGPLTVPTRTPVDIIRQLLLQSGPEKLTIYEVPFKSATPAQLTLDNYDLPYEKIMNTLPAETIEVPNLIATNDTPPAPVFATEAPTAEAEMEGPTEDPDPVAVVAEPVAENDQDNEEAQQNAEYQEAREEMLEEHSEPTGINVNEVMDTPSVNEELEKVEAVATETAVAPAEVVDKYAGMTKAERKAARRAEREAEAVALASAN